MNRSLRETSASDGRIARRAALDLESLALYYIAAPVVLFIAGWIVFPLGPIAAIVMSICVASVVRRSTLREAGGRSRALWLLVIVVATAWCVLAGIGHLVFANSDWWVRDAVLLDLVRYPWPVRYGVDQALILRTPVGFYLPAALFGKVFGIRAAELALLVWTALGVSMVLALLIGDRPSLRAACIRLGIFVLFSGMDILPTLARDNPHEVGAMIEWWARFMQYPSHTTALFWAPNHTLPGWIAAAWILSRDLRCLSIARASLFVVLSPIWAPLTALGVAPLVGTIIVHRATIDGWRSALRAAFDWRVAVVTALCALLVYPYLVADSAAIAAGIIPAGLFANIPWVGDDYLARYLEFVLVEFAGFAVLLTVRQPRDPLLWVAIGILFALPFFRFGPYNDLVMRTSCAPLALLAIRLGQWLSSPRAATESPGLRSIAIVLLVVGAVTPFMELARPFIAPAWPMNTHASLLEVTEGTHYFTSGDHPWLNRILRPAGT